MGTILRKQGRNITVGESGGGGLTQEEHDALMSIGSYIPSIYDVNPTRETSTYDQHNVAGCLIVAAVTTQTYPDIAICGYDKISIRKTANALLGYTFRYADGSTGEIVTLASNGWTDWISIPSNAIALVCKINNTSSGTTGVYLQYALLTASSPYNPDNITP